MVIGKLNVFPMQTFLSHPKTK